MYEKWLVALAGWKAIQEDWTEAKAEDWLAQSRQALFLGDDFTWLFEILNEGTEPDHQNFNFLYWLLLGLKQIPEVLFTPFLKAAVYDPDPSFNRWFIEICLSQWGGITVNDELLRYTAGTNLEKAGVTNAFYWSLRSNYDSIHGGTTHNLPTVIDVPTQQQIERVRYWRLQEFVQNDDVPVRRNIVPSLQLDPEKYPEALRSLIPEAIAIARAHSDYYIRHRIEIQLGSGGPMKPLPHRTK
jgi:hypothetical protein